jgi:hypothetical protein
MPLGLTRRPDRSIAGISSSAFRATDPQGRQSPLLNTEPINSKGTPLRAPLPCRLETWVGDPPFPPWDFRALLGGIGRTEVATRIRLDRLLGSSSRSPRDRSYERLVCSACASRSRFPQGVRQPVAC